MTVEQITHEARKYALQNAVQFDGKANEKAVAGKVIAVFKQRGVTPNNIIPVVRAVVAEINQMKLSDQITELQTIAPELLVREKKERDFSLPELPFAEKGKVVTRFPPEPNGYLHIGHAKAAIIDHEYARMYDGRFLLRFDDTNPDNVDAEFYDAQKEDLTWLGISWDYEYCTSDNLETHYKLAEQLIQQGDAYLCRCPPDAIKEGRFHSKACSCKEKSCGDMVDEWRDLLASPEHKGVILRLHGELGSDNTAMRDPTLFRVIDTPHPRTGTKYHVWPTYDFAGAVEDSLSGVTHPFRTKEYELRDPVYFRILSLLKLRPPHLMEFSRLSIEGMPVSKRKIKPLIDQGLVSGFDDVRLPTLRGLQRRGIVPEAIKQFVFSQGISKMESVVDFSMVEAFNRKILDPKVKRFFFVPHPVRLDVKDAPVREVVLRFHPSVDLGERVMHTDSTFFIQRDDVRRLKIGDLFRLKGLYNVRIEKQSDTGIVGSYAGDEVIAETSKIQWTTSEHVEMTVQIPGPLLINDQFNPRSLKTISGYAEPMVALLNTGDIVQFERFGFVRIEKQNTRIIGFFTHK
ncbi:MAG: glutamate--tRNA ligase [Candidatus Thermoplasmatota archaeon]